jgi:hypothetical protein
VISLYRPMAWNKSLWPALSPLLDAAH